MLRGIICASCFFASLFISSTTSAQEFSADIVNLKPDSKPGMSKLYVGKGKMRFESQGQQAGPGAFIIDEVQNTQLALMPERHMYMDMGQMHSLPVTFNFWRPPDADDACPQWKKLAEQLKTSGKLGSCTKLGSDTVNGRSAIKYEGTSTDGKTSYVWIDTRLRYVVKVQSPTGGMELRNIQEGPQPASLFEIPAGYNKMDMGGMMKQH